MSVKSTKRLLNLMLVQPLLTELSAANQERGFYDQTNRTLTFYFTDCGSFHMMNTDIKMCHSHEGCYRSVCGGWTVTG